ncbi:uncharacterized protein [Linepithema humile]|uniref:uncharacterized protein n=1 Tax=Linepithema humile TaxID=83485 RepID=UPI00351E3C1D
MMDDKQTSQLQHLSLISDVCEAVIQHMQSLQVSYLVVKRIFDMSHALLACHPPSSADEDFISHYRQIEIEKEKRISSLRELLECCSTNITFPKNMCAPLDDYGDRKKDFFLASANFKSLLENSRLSVSQMEKLQRQYDTILKDFQQSRRLLDAELPKIIDSRLEALRQIFDNVAELYNNMDYNMHTANLFKLIAVNLRQIAPDFSEKAIFHEQEANKEIYQKCKIDYVDKK